MNIEHIKDQVESYGYIVALDAYQLGMQHARELFVNDKQLPESDDLQDELRQIAKDKLKGTK